MEYIIIGAVAFIFMSIIVMLIITYSIGKKVFHDRLVRTSKEKWGRVCSAPENSEQLAMWNSGLEWQMSHDDKKIEVCITNDSLSLYGEYYDFGSKRCVIIIPGRCESLAYSYYFAEAYSTASCNVLVVDMRCHGKSDGVYNTFGVGESSDIIAWSKLLHDTYGIDEVVLHGICLGGGTAVITATRSDCPAYINKIVTEGCYTTFYESFARHTRYENHPAHPVVDWIRYFIKRTSGTDILITAPIKVINRLELPALFLFGKQDVFSIPKKSQLLFDRCKSSKKVLVWFEKGSHSHLRINNKEAYDASIKHFIEQTDMH